jgi:hypothetical protein
VGACLCYARGVDMLQREEDLNAGGRIWLCGIICVGVLSRRVCSFLVFDE